MRVLVCDDNEDAQLAIGRISEASTRLGGEELIVAGWAESARAGKEQALSTRADVILIDLFLPVTTRSAPAAPSGPWLARAIKRAFEQRGRAQPPMALWTSNVASSLDVRNHCRAFLHHGGAAIIDKERHDAGEKLAILESVLAGERAPLEHDDGLTPRERDVLTYYAAGYDLSSIATELVLSTATVDRHIGQIRSKLVSDPSRQAKGAGPVLAAAAAPNSTVSWVPIEHLGPPPRLFAALEA